MTESRIIATERLRREGFWDEASAFRDEVRRKLRAEKKTRAEANDGAWAAMLQKYPPLPVDETAQAEASVEQEAEDFEALMSRVKDKPSDVDRDVLWAYEHLGVRGVTPDDAPSFGAWNLLKWARENRNRFFEQMVLKALGARRKRGNEVGAGGDQVVDMGIEQVRERLREAFRQIAMEFIADAPAEIRLQVQSAVEEWARRGDLSLSADAQMHLVQTMIDLTCQCVEMALARPEQYKLNNKEFRERHCHV